MAEKTKQKCTDDQSFREHVVETLTRVETKLDVVVGTTKGHDKTLYGLNGMGGLAGELSQLKHSQKLWTRSLMILQALLAGVLAYLGIKR